MKSARNSGKFFRMQHLKHSITHQISPSFTAESTSKGLSWSEIQIITLSQLLLPQNNKEWDKTKVLIQKQSAHLFVCNGSKEARKCSTSNYEHPLINLIGLSVKERCRETSRVRSMRRKVLCSTKKKRRRRSCVDGPCRLRQSWGWNKRRTALLMKGRVLTGIALAQCARWFCQWRLQRYNKVHEHNEAWEHLTLRQVDSLQWDSLSFWTLPLHFYTLS